MKLYWLGLIGFVSALVAFAGSPSDIPSGMDLPSAPPGRIIVKYRDSVPVCVHCWHEQGRLSGLSTSGGDRSLDELHGRFHVRSVMPLFRTEEEERQIGAGTLSVDAIRRHHESGLRAAHSRFAARARRAAAAASGRVPRLHHVYLLELASGVNPAAAAAAFARDAHVEYAHPDYLVQLDYTPNDPYLRSAGSWKQSYPDLWALGPDRLDMAPAWDLSQGSGIVVAVVDSGLDANHPDMLANVWKNPGEIAGNKIDDDRNGFVDDVTGWSFVTCKELESLEKCKVKSAPGPVALDDNGHGTHVAGTIAAVGNNARGIIGVAPRAKILPLKAFNKQGLAFSSEVAPALVYAAANGAEVINNSWGCGFCPEVPLYTDTLRALHGLGIVTVFAAGNSATDVRFRSPHNSHDPKPIVVAATNPNDELAWFSSFGPAVDVAAPGAGRSALDPGILSLKAADCFLCAPKAARKFAVQGEYFRLQGTSMAAPHVSGLAALLLAQRPTLSNDGVRQVIKAAADDVEANGYDLKTGAGRIDALQALSRVEPLEVKIDHPANFSLPDTETFTITGTAAGPGFDRYQLFFQEEDGDGWSPVGPPVSAEARGGELGRWSLAGLPLGWKALRLQATTQSGLEFNDVIQVGKQLASSELVPGPDRAAPGAEISGDLVVWAGDTTEDPRYGFKSRIYIHDLVTDSTIRVSPEIYTEANPQVVGNLVVWSDSGSKDRRLLACRYERASASCVPFVVFSARAGQGGVGRVAISPERIAWTGVTVRKNGLDPYIAVYDLASRALRKIPYPRLPILLALDGDLLVTVQARASFGPKDQGNQEIFVRNLLTNVETQITHSPEEEWFPHIEGRRILFERWSLDSNTEPKTSQLILYDLDLKREEVVHPSFTVGGLVGGSFSGNRVVWRRVSDIHMLDLDSGIAQPVVVSPMVLRLGPDVSGDRIVWTQIADPIEEIGDLFITTIPD